MKVLADRTPQSMKVLADRTPQSMKVLDNFLKFNLEAAKLETGGDLNDPKCLAAEKAVCSHGSANIDQVRDFAQRIRSFANSTLSQRTSASFLLIQKLKESARYREAMETCCQV